MISYTTTGNSLYSPSHYFTQSTDISALSKGDLISCGNYIFVNIGAAQNNNLGILAYHVSGCNDPIACNYIHGAAHENIICSYRQPADFDCSMRIDIHDLIELIQNFGCLDDCEYCDLNGDGWIGVQDLMMVVENAEGN